MRKIAIKNAFLKNEIIIKKNDLTSYRCQIPAFENCILDLRACHIPFYTNNSLGEGMGRSFRVKFFYVFLVMEMEFWNNIQFAIIGFFHLFICCYNAGHLKNVYCLGNIFM